MTENILLRSARYLWPLCVLSVGLLSAPELLAVEDGAADETSPLVINNNHPQRYSVVRGDTLWDISTHFLRDPWRWPELWQKNQQIDNPHLIYPGDILTLVYINGVPTLQLDRMRPSAVVQSDVQSEIVTEQTPSGYKTVKLMPQIRVESLEKAIPTIPIDTISQFLSKSKVVTKKELKTAPYIVSSADEHLIIGAGNRVFVRGITSKAISDYMVVRLGRALKNRKGKVLGYEAIYVADAHAQVFGTPSTFMLTKTRREVLKGDLLVPIYDDIPKQDLHPKAPKNDVDGNIIAVVDGVKRIGQYMVVVLDLGRKDELEVGNVLAVYQKGETIRDTVKGGSVRIPDQRAGVVLVFRAFDRLSYALVMEASRPMRVWDMVTNP